MLRRSVVFSLGLFLAALLVLAQLAAAQGSPESDSFWRKPLHSQNQFPILLLFLGFDPERAVSLGQGETSFNLDLSLSNIIKTSTASPDPSADSLVFDYEWWRMLAQYEVGLGSGWEASVSLPLYYRSGGFLDPFISGFHEIFGFTNNIRSRTPDNLFRYELIINGTRVLGPLRRGMAAGDLVLSLKKSWNLSGTEVGLRAAIKAPTGSWSEAAGSGAFDLGLGFLLSGAGSRVGYTLNAGYYFLGRTKIPGLVPRDHLSLMAGLDVLLGRRLALVAQVDYISRFAESMIPILSQETGQVTAGFRWRFARRMVMEFRLSEDLAVANPDFTLGLRLEFLTGSAR